MEGKMSVELVAKVGTITINAFLAGFPHGPRFCGAVFRTRHVPDPRPLARTVLEHTKTISRLRTFTDGHHAAEGTKTSFLEGW